MCQFFTQRISNGKRYPANMSARIDWQPDMPFALLTIRQHGEDKDYLFEELHARGGDFRLFNLYQPSSDPINAPEEATANGYTVEISGLDPAQDSCTCSGHNYTGRCKHADSLRALIGSGELPDPRDEAANMALSAVGEDCPF